jgi:Zn-dependent protease with chaperone function
MNFYARQEASRRTTKRLVFLFLLAVIVIAAAVNLVVLTVLSSAEANTLLVPDGRWIADHDGVVAGTTLVVVAIIAIASLYRSAALRGGGGGVVARALGGTRVDRTQQDPLRHRLFNVVEEMSIASGVPLPEIYVLEHEAGINAFAAGHLPANAAIAVTRGALEQLNRAELQGVIAHEFSHVLNGDMRLNTRLMGMLFGLLVVAMIGRAVLRHSPRGRSSGKRGGGAGAVMLAALAIMILGYIGVFFGRLIQAAISRQREVLADASAVQFTRDPHGLRNALVRIGAPGAGSKLTDADSEEVAHMLFAPGMQRWFATHPPILERIRALDPRFDPQEFARVAVARRAAEEAAAEQERKSEAAAARASPAIAAALPLAIAAEIAHRAGSPGTEDVDAARVLAGSIPGEVVAALDSPRRAPGTLVALILDPNPDARERQRAVVRERLGESTLAEVDASESHVASLARAQRLLLLEQLFPTLRQLPREQRQRIVETLHRLMLLDGRVEIFEYALAALARLYLRDELNPAAPGGGWRLDQVTPELQALFSTLARHGTADEVQARRAYEAGMHHLLPRHRPEYRPVPGWPRALDSALDRLDRLLPIAKEQVVEALMKTVGHDGQLSIAEAELLRVICAALHCPLPPLVSVTPPAT